MVLVVGQVDTLAVAPDTAVGADRDARAIGAASTGAAGVAAQRVAGSVTMQGTVRDANTLAEEIEYWEVRGTAGETIVITGRKDIPLIQWLRQAKNRPVRLTAGSPCQEPRSRDDHERRR